MSRFAISSLTLLMVVACGQGSSNENVGQSTPEQVACAQSEAPVAIEGAWMRAVSSEGGNTAAYFLLCNNTDAPLQIVSASSDFARATEIHRTKRDENNVVRMAPAGELIIEPGSFLSFEPGGLHVMLMGVDQAIDEGAERSIALILADGGVIDIALRTQSQSTAAHEKDNHNDHSGH